jgi:transposase-like protein
MSSIVHIYRRFPTPESCIAHLEEVRWGDSPFCPYCHSPRVGRKNDGGQRWNCHLCRKSFSVTVGTIFHNSHIDLQRWFLLIALIFSAKKGLSAMQAARDLEMRRPTVWSMMHRIRNAMKDDGQLLMGLVEMDETYVGGKPRKGNRRDDDPKGGDKSKRGRGTDKTPVVGAVERGGRVKAKPVSKDAMDGEAIKGLILGMMDTKRTLLTTDEYSGYNAVNKYVAHRRINHSVSYVERDLFSGQFGAIHTNTIESFWAIVKRAIYGQFHHVSKKYMHLYINELSYRYNMRKEPWGLEAILCLAVKP